MILFTDDGDRCPLCGAPRRRPKPEALSEKGLSRWMLAIYCLAALAVVWLVWQLATSADW